MAYTPVHEFLLEKPKRPLSAYNYYFAFERQKLLAERKTGQEGSKGIGFANMGRTIANRWNNLKLHEKTQFQELAKKDKIRYKKEMDIWKQSQIQASQIASEECRSQGPPKEILLNLDSEAGQQDPLQLDSASFGDSEVAPTYTSTSARLLEMFNARSSSFHQPQVPTAQLEFAPTTCGNQHNTTNHNAYTGEQQNLDCAFNNGPYETTSFQCANHNSQTQESFAQQDPPLRHSSSASRLLQLFQARSRSSKGNFSL